MTSVLTSQPSERPIAVGDWVECVDLSGLSNNNDWLTLGSRYEVEAVHEYYLDLHAGPQWDSGKGWRKDRFKRVDWSHLDSVATHDGPVAIVRDGHGNIDTVPQCATCTSPATTGEHCVYCAARDAGHAEIDARLAMDQESAKRGHDTRLLQGLASERPRQVDSAERRELAKKHPWEEFE